MNRLSVLRRLFSTLPDHTRVIMPKVSPTMTAGRLVSWKKSEGDAISEGEDLADVESDKATMPISARDDGFVARIFVDEDTPDIPLGKLLAIVVEEEEDVAAFENYKLSADEAIGTPAAAPSEPPIAQIEQPVHQKNAGTTSNTAYTGPIGPAVLRLLNQHKGINLAAVQPTGPKGRILKGDVLAAIESGAAFTASTAESTTPTNGAEKSATEQAVPPPKPAAGTVPTEEVFYDTPASGMRRAIASRLTKTAIPHEYQSVRCNLREIGSFRKMLKERGVAVSVNDVILKAVATALSRVPSMLADTNGDIDVSFAVAVPGGLITPIVRGADRLGLGELARRTADLAVRAKDGALDPEEYEGGSFSVSNLGMLGVANFSAIINPPQHAILAVGAPLKELEEDESGRIAERVENVSTLSYDIRVIDQESASRFLDEFRECMSDPARMIM